MELGNLLLGFAQGGGARQTLVDRLTLDFASEAELRIMPGVMGTGTMTGRFATETPGRGNGAGAEISQAEELLQQSGTLGFKGRDGIGHGWCLLSESYYTLRKEARSRKSQQSRFLCRAPPCKFLLCAL